MRVVHLVECVGSGASSDAAILACRAALRARGVGHEVWLVADSAGESRARALGLRTPLRVTPPLGRAELAWGGLRQLAASRPSYSVVQAWSERAGRAARWAGLTPVVPLPPSLGSPGVPLAHRTDLRRRLELDDDDFAVLLLADPPREAHTARFTFLIGLLDFSGRPAAGVVPSGSGGIARARAFHRRAVLECPIRFSCLPAGVLAAACDLAVLHVPEAHEDAPSEAMERRRALVRMAHGAGLPVVAPARAALGSVVRPREGAEGLELECPGDRPADYARAVAAAMDRRDSLRAAAESLKNEAERDRRAGPARLLESWLAAAAVETGAAP